MIQMQYKLPDGNTILKDEHYRIPLDDIILNVCNKEKITDNIKKILSAYKKRSKYYTVNMIYLYDYCRNEACLKYNGNLYRNLKVLLEYL